LMQEIEKSSHLLVEQLMIKRKVQLVKENTKIEHKRKKI